MTLPPAQTGQVAAPPAVPVVAAGAVAGGAAAHAGVAANGPAADPGTASARQIPVAKGQVILATVAQVQDGTAWISWRGSVFAARTELPLVAGKTYEFLVARTEPQITLTGLPKELPGLAELPRRLGQSGSELGARLAAFDQGAVLPRAPRGEAPSAAVLQGWHRALGHEQEAAVLRLPPQHEHAAAPELVGSLRATLKAAALMLLGDPALAAAAPPARRRAAQELVTGLNRIERDNAARADAGMPMWLPLPADPEAGLRDARMFLVRDGAGQAARGGPDAVGAPFTIVLLLDLQRLGELRVDVTVQQDRVAAAFTLLEPAAVGPLHAALPELEHALVAAGLRCDGLLVRQAPPQGLPVADLILPPRDRNGLVDCHA